MKNKKAITLVEIIVGVSISMILMVSIGVFVSSGISNLFIQEKSFGNILSINNFSEEIRNELNNIEKNINISGKSLIFKRKKEYNIGGFSYIGIEEKDNFYCKNQKTKHIFIKNFIPYNGINYEIKYGNLTSNQKENKVFENKNKIVGINFYGKDFDSGENSDKVPLNGPTGILKDTKGNIYISDTLNNRILKRNSFGQVFHFMGEESGLLEPNGLFLDGNTLYIANSGKNEILKLQEKIESPNYNHSFNINTKKDFDKIKITYIKEIGEDSDEKIFSIEENIIEKIKKTKIDFVEKDLKTYFEIKIKESGKDIIEELDENNFENLKNSGKDFKLLRIKKIFYLYTAKLGTDFDFNLSNQITQNNKIQKIESLEKLEKIPEKEFIYFDKDEKKFYKKEIIETGTIKENKYFEINKFNENKFSLNLPKIIGNFGKGKFFAKIDFQLNNSIIYSEEKKIFFNDVKEFKKHKSSLKYPYKINSINNFLEFDINSPGEIKFDENYDKILDIPIKDLDISKNGDIITILIKYYRNYNCEDLESNEQKINTIILKKKIN